MAKLTEADFESWRFKRDAVHFNGGAAFFGYGHRCIDQPRLLVIDKYFKKDRSTQRSYLIDGKTAFQSLDEALAALSSSPQLSIEEQEILTAIPDDWFRPEKRARFIPIAEMGLAEWRQDEGGVFIRRTDAGRAALATIPDERNTSQQVCGECGGFRVFEGGAVCLECSGSGRTASVTT